MLPGNLPEKYRQAILQRLDTLSLRQGKASLQIEVNCGTGNVVSSIKVKTMLDEEIRL